MPEFVNINENVFDRRFRENQRTDYDSIDGRLSRRDRQIRRLLDEKGVRGAKCLDIGPGTGRWLQYLRSSGASGLAAVDLSREALDRAARLGVECQKADVEYQALEFDAETYDIVLAFMVLEHLRTPELFVREVLRVAKTSALILMTIPNIASLQSRLRLLMGRLPAAVSQDPTHVRFYTRRELNDLFRPIGGDVEVIPTSFSLHPLNRKRLCIPSTSFLAGLDDHQLFKVSKMRLR